MPGKNSHNLQSYQQGESSNLLTLLPEPTPPPVERVAELPTITSLATPTAEEQVEFRQFSDGTLAELVRDPIDPKRTNLLIWKDGQYEIRTRFPYDATEFVARALEPSLLEAVRLPVGVVPCGSTDALLRDLHRCLFEHMDTSDEQIRLICQFVLCSWFPDRLPLVPYLWIVGPYGSGKTKLLRLLQVLCRHGITGSDFTPTSLYSVPSAIMPTLIIDEFENRRSARDQDLLRLLRTGSAPGGQVLRGARVFKTFCAKIVASRQGPLDGALASRAIFISLRPSRKSLPVLDDGTLDAIADHFQPRMLGYRLQRYTRVRMNPECEMPEFTPRMRDLALALAAPLLGDAEEEKKLFELLVPQDKEAKLSHLGEPEWAVATALYDECHRTHGALTAGSLAFKVNEVLMANCETDQLKPRAVGGILRTLGFQTQQLGNQGRGLRLTGAIVRQIHQLAWDLGLKRSDILPYLAVDAGHSGPPCALCEKFGLMVDQDGNALRCVPIRKPQTDSTLFSK